MNPMDGWNLARSRGSRRRILRVRLWNILRLCLVLLTIGLLPANSTFAIVVASGVSSTVPADEESSPQEEEGEDSSGESESCQPARRRICAVNLGVFSRPLTAAIVADSTVQNGPETACLPGSEHSRRNGLGTAIRC